MSRAAGGGSLLLPVADIVPLNDAIRLLGDVETGKKIGGKGLIVMD